MRPRVSLRDALTDPALLGHVLHGPSWLPWRVLLIAGMGEALTDEERPIFTQLTGRAREPLQRVNEFAGVIGRRGGKTTAMQLGRLISRLRRSQRCARPRRNRRAALCGARPAHCQEAPGLRARPISRDSEILRQLIKGRSQDSIELTNNISIEVRPASFRKLQRPHLRRRYRGRAGVLVHRMPTMPIPTSRCSPQRVPAC